MPALHRVIIVKEGHWGDLRQEKGDYDDTVDLLREVLNEAERIKDGTYYEKEKAAEVLVVSSLAEGLKKVTHPESGCTLVFVTRGMLREAERVKGEHPYLRVVLFTGLFPREDHVIILQNDSIPQLIEHAVLHWG